MNYYRRHPMNYYNPFLDERHKVFVSYYHREDQYYRELFEDMFQTTTTSWCQSLSN